MVWFNHNLISHCSFPNNRIQLLSSGKEEMLLESEEEDFLLESACETARLFVYQISYRRWAPKLATSKKNDSNFTWIIGFPMVFKRKAWWGPRITAKWALFCPWFSDEESERCRGGEKRQHSITSPPFFLWKDIETNRVGFTICQKTKDVLSLVCMSNTDGETRVMRFPGGNCITLVVFLSDVCMSRELPKIASQESFSI